MNYVKNKENGLLRINYMSEEPKKKRKHRKHTLNDFYHGNKLHKEKYGFIEIDNPEYYKKNNGYWSVPEFLMRKPTPEERKEIIVNYVITQNGEYIDMFALADKLCISNRLMQMILKNLREEGVIEVIHTFGEMGKQLRNKYKYIGPPFEFWEKEPKQKYRKKQTEYRHKGKIPQSVIEKMHERLNLFLADEHIYSSRDEALRQLKELSVTHGFERFCEKEARREIMELARDLPVGAKIFYGHKDMEPFRPRIDKIVNLLLPPSKSARKTDLKFHEDLATLEQKTKVNGGILDEIKEDYKRRQGNERGSDDTCLHTETCRAR